MVDEKVSEVLTELTTVLSTDSEIVAWVLTNFSKAHTTYEGWDESDPPPYDETNPANSEYPLIVIHSVGKSRANGDRVRQYTARIGIVIYDNGRVQTGNVVRFSGLPKVEDFRHVIENAIFRANILQDCKCEGGNDPEVSISGFHQSVINVTWSPLKSNRKPYGTE